MNEVFEKLSDVFEELRSEADEREYSIQTEEAKKADKELKKENREYEKFLSDLSTEQRNFLENYMDIVEHAHFQEQQRAYYQGIVDAVQILAGLGIVKESVKVKELSRLNTEDDYIAESEVFRVLDYDIEVKDELISEALKYLPEKKRNVILLSFFLDMTDTEIAKHMNLVRSTIHHHRVSSLQALKKIMEGIRNGEIK